LKYLMIRGAISIVLVTTVLLIASSSIQDAGMADPSNPAWVFIHSLLAAELYAAKMIGSIVVLAVLGAGMFEYCTKWCSGLESNQHTSRYTPLKRACLPIPPPEHTRESINTRVDRN